MPRRSPRIADVIKYLMDQHGLTRADLVPILGTASRVSEVLRGKKGLSMAMVQRLRARFRVSADVLLAAPHYGRTRRQAKRVAADTSPPVVVCDNKSHHGAKHPINPDKKRKNKNALVHGRRSAKGG